MRFDVQPSLLAASTDARLMVIDADGYEHRIMFAEGERERGKEGQRERGTRPPLH